MSVDNSEFLAFQAQIQALKDDIPEIMNQLAVGEGRYARDQARKICKEENIVNTGDYRKNFKSGTKAIRKGRSYKIDVFNNLDYAKPLEYGFRSHFVPGHWEGKTFKYQPNDPQGGMVMPGKKNAPNGYMRGKFTLRRAIKRTKTTQAARLNRKMNRIIRDHLK